MDLDKLTAQAKALSRLKKHAELLSLIRALPENRRGAELEKFCARSEIATKEIQAGLASYERAIALSPRDISLREECALASYRNGDLERTLEHLLLAREMQNELIGAHSYLYQSLSRLKRWNMLERCLREDLRRSDGDQAALRLELARTLIMRLDEESVVENPLLAEAAELYESVLSGCGGGDAAAIAAAGQELIRLRLRMNDNVGAEAAARRVLLLEAEPSSAQLEAEILLAEALDRQDRYEEAGVILERLRLQEREDPFPLLTPLVRHHGDRNPIAAGACLMELIAQEEEIGLIRLGRPLRIGEAPGGGEPAGEKAATRRILQLGEATAVVLETLISASVGPTAEEAHLLLDELIKRCLPLVLEIPSDKRAAQKNQNLLFQAWERAMAALDSNLSGSLVDQIARMQGVFAKDSRQVMRLAHDLLNAGREEEAARLIRALVVRRPQAPGYFTLTMRIKDRLTRQAIQKEAFTLLTPNVERGEIAVIRTMSNYLLQVVESARAWAMLEQYRPTAEADDPGFLISLAETAFWSDRFEDSARICDELLPQMADLSSSDQTRLTIMRIRNQIVAGDSAALAEDLERFEWAPSPDRTRFVDYITANLALGRIGEAFDNYLHFSSTIAMREMGFPIVAQETRGGSCLLIRGGLGVGDEVRLARLLPEIRARFDSLTMSCDRRLLPVFMRSFPNVDFLPFDKGRPAPGLNAHLINCFDAETLRTAQTMDHVGNLSQFMAFLRRSVADCLEAPAAHIVPAPHLLALYRRRVESENVIGLFWRSSLPNYAARHKQSDLAGWLDLLRDLPIRIVPLQYDLLPEEDALMEADGRFLRLDREFDVKNDLERMFALLAALPLVISPPGTTQHMAGAVGTPVLSPTHPAQAPWRRLFGHDREIWSSSVEIVSGPASEGLGGAMRQVAEILKERTSRRTTP